MFPGVCGCYAAQAGPGGPHRPHLGAGRRAGRRVIDDKEGWGHLDTTGLNGMLNVLISVRWWKDALGEETAPKWDAAVTEVSSALKQTL